MLEVGAGQHRTPTLAWSRQWSCYNGGGSAAAVPGLLSEYGEVNTRMHITRLDSEEGMGTLST